MSKKLIARILMSLSGVIICAFAVGILKIAALGVDPFQSFMSGLNKLIPISFGTLYMVVNGLLLLFSIVFDRSNIGIATFINLFLLGYVTDFSLMLLSKVFVNPGIVTRIVLLLVAIVIICFGSSLYMTASLGVSTYDAIAITMSGKWKLGKFKTIRTITDFICVILGIVLYLIGGGNIREVTAFVGVGTIITAFFMGPLIELFNNRFSVPLLSKYE